MAKNKKPLPVNEQETIIQFYRDDVTLELYTSDRTMMTKMNNLVRKNPDDYITIEDDEFSTTYKFPKDLLSFRTKKTSRNLTDEQREQLSDRMKTSRKAND